MCAYSSIIAVSKLVRVSVIGSPCKKSMYASSFKVIVRPTNVNVHLLSMQHRCFSLAASKACFNTKSMSLECGRMWFWRVARSQSESHLSALSKRLWLKEGLEVACCDDEG